MKSKTFLFCLSLLVLGLCLLPAGICSKLMADAPTCQFSLFDTGTLTALVAVLGIGLGMAYSVKDNALMNTKALPNGANTVAAAGFDLGLTSRGDFVAPCELQIEAPALDATALPNSQTMIYHVYHSDNADFSSESLVVGNVLTQTGADGAGAAAATKQCRLPVDVKRYVRVKAVKSGTGDASGSSFVSRLVF